MEILLHIMDTSGKQTTLELDPYNSSKRIIIVFEDSVPNINECIHLTGKVHGTASVETYDITVLDVLYIVYQSVYI